MTKNYIQIEGVIIGSRLGKKLRMHVHKEVGRGTFDTFYKRFIDDGFGIWTGSEEDLKEFAAFANGIHGNIKVELRYDQKQIEF